MPILDDNEMLALPDAPADCIEPIRTAFAIATLANELLLLSSEVDESEAAQIDEIQTQIVDAFELAWQRAGRFVRQGNWPTTQMEGL